MPYPHLDRNNSKKKLQAERVSGCRGTMEGPGAPHYREEMRCENSSYREGSLLSPGDPANCHWDNRAGAASLQVFISREISFINYHQAHVPCLGNVPIMMQVPSSQVVLRETEMIVDASQASQGQLEAQRLPRLPTNLRIHWISLIMDAN